MRSIEDSGGLIFQVAMREKTRGKKQESFICIMTVHLCVALYSITGIADYPSTIFCGGEEEEIHQSTEGEAGFGPRFRGRRRGCGGRQGLPAVVH